MPTQVRANLPVTDVVRTYYSRIPQDSWAWVREAWVGDGSEVVAGFLIVEDDAGFIWRVPYEVDTSGAVDFGEPTRVRLDYEDSEDQEGERESVVAAKVVRLSRPPQGTRPAARLLKAVARHSTDTSDAAWDGTANETRLSNDDGESVYRQAFAWQDPDADPDTKSAWRFIHHFVDQDGTVGAASTTACSTAIGVLNGGRGTDVAAQPWANDRTDIYDHLAGHLIDAGYSDENLPELQSLSAAHVAATVRKERDMTPSELRRTIGLPEDATEEEVAARVAELAALNEAGAQAPPEEPQVSEQPPQEPPPPEEPQQPQASVEEPTPPPGSPSPEAVAASLRKSFLASLDKQGLALIDRGRLERLEAFVATAEQERQKAAEKERDDVLRAAADAGKFPPARIQHYRALWDADPQGTREFIDKLSAGLVPVGERGHGSGGEETLSTEWQEFSAGMLPELRELRAARDGRGR